MIQAVWADGITELTKITMFFKSLCKICFRNIILVIHMFYSLIYSLILYKKMFILIIPKVHTQNLFKTCESILFTVIKCAYLIKWFNSNKLFLKDRSWVYLSLCFWCDSESRSRRFKVRRLFLILQCNSFEYRKNVSASEWLCTRNIGGSAPDDLAVEETVWFLVSNIASQTTLFSTQSLFRYIHSLVWTLRHPSREHWLLFLFRSTLVWN